MPMSEKRFNKKLEKIKKQGERYKQEKELKDAYAQYVPDKKKRKISNVMLIVTVIAIVGYVIANYILQYNMGVELSPTITPFWFAFWTSELFALMGIRVSKLKHNSDVSDIEEDFPVETYDDENNVG